MSAYPHRITYAIGNEGRWRFFPEIDRYDIACDMLDPADAISLSVPFRKDVWELVRGDNLVNVWIDDQRVFSGIIDDRERTVSREGSQVAFTARDKVGRLIDESAPLIRLEGLGIVDLAVRLVEGDLKVETSNATNRRLVTGAGGKRIAREPAIDRGATAKRKVEPGESKWAVLHHFLEEARLLAWASADGSTLVIGRPNYQQPAQWTFAVPAHDDLDAGGILSYRRKESLAERYSRIDVLRTIPGSEEEYGERLRQRGTARNGPAADGTGRDFRLPKRLTIRDDRGRAGSADDRARQEMAERDAGGNEVAISVWGHGQRPHAAAAPALYTFDTIADVDDQEIRERGAWYVTSVRYQGSKDEGQRTDLRMVPIGTDLRMA